jgi:hypothetical protein
VGKNKIFNGATPSVLNVNSFDSTTFSETVLNGFFIGFIYRIERKIHAFSML